MSKFTFERQFRCLRISDGNNIMRLDYDDIKLLEATLEASRPKNWLKNWSAREVSLDWMAN